MRRVENFKLALLALGVVVGMAAKSEAQAQPTKMRKHTATAAKQLMLVPAKQSVERSMVNIEIRGAKR